MTKKYKILTNFIKDMSSETPDIETFLYVKEYISKYKLHIDINSKALKNKMVEINTILRFADNTESKKKSVFELIYATIIKLDDDLPEKQELQKIILCDVQNEIYEKLEQIFINLLHNSGYVDVKFEKKINFEELYTEQFIKKNSF